MEYLIVFGIVMICFGLLGKIEKILSKKNILKTNSVTKEPLKKVTSKIKKSKEEQLQRIEHERIEFEKYKLEEKKKEEEEFFLNWREELIGKSKSKIQIKARENILKKLKLKEQEKTQKYYKISQKDFDKANDFESEQLDPLREEIKQIETEILHEKAIDDPSINLEDYELSYKLHKYRLKRFWKSKILGYYDYMKDGKWENLKESEKRFEGIGSRGGRYITRYSKKTGMPYRQYY